MTYTVSRAVMEGLKVVVAMEENYLMPAVEDIIVELEFVETQINKSEKFYGVPFRNKQKEYCVVEDVKSLLEEFYFGDGTRPYHLYRVRPLYRLVIEPLLDELAVLSHDEILDYTSAVIEQLKEYAMMYRTVNQMDYRQAYNTYQQLATARQNDKKIATIVEGIMKLRRKSLSLFKQLSTGSQPVPC